MSFTYCSSGAIVWRAGRNINPTVAASQAIIQQFCDNAEGFVNTATRYDWTAASAAITTSYPHYKPVLAEVIGSLAAIDCITYDMSGIGNVEAQNRINVLYDRVNNGLTFITKWKKPEVSF